MYACISISLYNIYIYIGICISNAPMKSRENLQKQNIDGDLHERPASTGRSAASKITSVDCSRLGPTGVEMVSYRQILLVKRFIYCGM